MSVFLYTCVDCDAPAKKVPCVYDKDEKQQTLGTWRCTQCKRVCKVSRTRNKDAK